MDLVQMVVDSFATGVVAAAKDSATDAVKSACQKLRARFSDRYPDVSTAALETKPESPLQRSALKEILMEAGAGSDPELLTLAVAMAEAIKADDPGAAATVGVDLSRIAADEINIEEIAASGGSTGVRASDVIARSVNIKNVEARGQDRGDPLGRATHEPGGAAQISNFTGRDLTYVGGDYTQHQHGASLPDIEVDLEIVADPLLRLFYDDEEAQLWLEKRKAYLEEKLIPKDLPKPAFPDLTRMLMHASDFGADRATFETRLAEHLRQCRGRLRDNALAALCENGYNSLIFGVKNPTDDPIVGTRVVASFYAGDAEVLASVPHADGMPASPTWPDPMDRYLGQFRHGLSEQLFTSPSLLAGRMASARVRNRDGFIEIEYLIGDLRAGQPEETSPVFIIPFISVDELGELDITVTAHALNRRSVKKERFTLEIERRGFPLDAVVRPNY